MKAGHVIALCIICTAAGAQLGGQPLPLGGQPVPLGGTPVPLAGSSAGGQLNQGSPLPNGYKAIQYKNVAQGVNSRITTARTDVINNSQAWRSFYSQMAGDTREGFTPAPVLCDFNQYDLLVIHLGQKRTTGHSAYVSMIRREKPSEVTVDVIIQQPTPNSAVAQQLTSPYVVVVVEKQNVPYSFRSTFGYTTTTYVGGAAPCGCTCGCPTCGGGHGGGNVYRGNGNSPFGGDICPPMQQQGGRTRGGGE